MRGDDTLICLFSILSMIVERNNLREVFKEKTKDTFILDVLLSLSNWIMIIAYLV